MLRWMNRSTAGGKSRAEKIAAMVEKIAGSDLSVDEFFRRYTVPFSRPQYFRYQARLAAQGLAGLLDGRRQGNRRKLTPEAEAFLRGAHQSNPQRNLQEMRSEEHTSELQSPDTISYAGCCLKKKTISSWTRESRSGRQPTSTSAKHSPC